MEKDLTKYRGNVNDFVRRVRDAMRQEGLEPTEETLNEARKIALGQVDAKDIVDDIVESRVAKGK